MRDTNRVELKAGREACEILEGYIWSRLLRGDKFNPDYPPNSLAPLPAPYAYEDCFMSSYREIDRN